MLSFDRVTFIVKYLNTYILSSRKKSGLGLRVFT